MSEPLLIHGDSINTVLKELISEGVKVDSVISDPPYGMNFQSNHRKDKYNQISSDDNINWLPDFIFNSLYSISNNNTSHFLFCSWHKIDVFKQEIEKSFNLKNILVWIKNNTSMGDLEADFAPKHEFIIYFQKGRRQLEGRRDPNVVEFPRTGNKFHPTEKPVELMEYLISKVTKPGELVLDPFMGSGTTGKACKNLNRDFIGIEIDETYYNTARTRILEGKKKKTFNI